jgi:tripartite-type tricarboxylate transporter receptor subunit TctC
MPPRRRLKAMRGDIMKTSLRKAATPRRHVAPRGKERRLATQYPRRRVLSLAAGAVAVPIVSRTAWAQAYPSRPITMIVPFPAGGPVDAAARILAEPMKRSLGGTIIIENVGGADGNIATGRLARARPDGYTIDFGGMSTHVLNGALYSLSYDVLNDFEPISLLASFPFVLFARKTLPANDLNELIAWLKANPNKASAGIAGASIVKLVTAFFQKQTGTTFTLVPYRGGAPAVQDLIAEQIDLVFGNPPFLPLVRDGKIRAYAVTSVTRLALAPNIPTLGEMGLPALSPSSWVGLFAPKGTPRDIIGKLNAAAVDALADPAVRQRLADLGSEVFPRDQQTAEALGAIVKAGAEKWWPIIKASGIKAE